MKLFAIIEQLNSDQIDQLHKLSQQMWWAKERTMEEVMLMLKNCMSFGVIENETQNLVGYARVLTDEIKYAYIFDVMIKEKHRGEGLGKLLMNSIIAHAKLKNIKNFELTCVPEMMIYYEQFGFSEDYGVEVKPMRFSRTV